MQTSQHYPLLKYFPRQPGLFRFTAYSLLVVVLSAAGGSRLYSAVQQVESIGLTVHDLDRAVRFFTKVLPFEEVSRSQTKGRTVDDLLGLERADIKVARLKLGSEQITLTEHLDKGRLVPRDSQSYDHWFQHIAIVVRDMDLAYEHLKKHKVKFVSTAPQTLPEWNHGAAGIRAFYFRDPEDHVLEIIWFPQGKGDPRWQSVHGSNVVNKREALFLGIDHTAIVVADTDRSLEFYRDCLGMRVAGNSENYGVEQEHLNQVFGAHLRITALRAEKGPGIEFLEYLAPPGGRDFPADTKANDLVFWRTDLGVDRLDDLISKVEEKGAKLVSKKVVSVDGSPAGVVREFILRDPDGHAIRLEQRSEPVFSARR